MLRTRCARIRTGEFHSRNDIGGICVTQDRREVDGKDRPFAWSPVRPWRITLKSLTTLAGSATRPPFVPPRRKP